MANDGFSFNWFLVTLKKYKFMYLELICIAVCLRLIDLVEPFIFQALIDRIIPFQRENSLVLVVWIFLGLSIFQLLFVFISDFLGISTSNSVTLELAERIYKHLFALPMSKFRKWSIGDATARLNETDTIREFLVGTTTGVSLDVLFVFVYLCILFSLSSHLTIIVILALPIQFFVYFAFGPVLRRRIQDSFSAGAKHQTQLIENIQGILTIKTLSEEEKYNTKLNRAFSEVINSSYRISKVQILSSNIIFVIDKAVTILIIYVGANSVFAGQMTMGELIAFHLISNKVFGPIQSFSKLWESWQNIRISKQRLGEIVSAETEPFEHLPDLHPSQVPKLVFRNVSFSYGDIQILNDFSAEFAPNTLNLVVGRSGVGKSTFGKLAIGIDSPKSGEVLLDRNSIAQFNPASVRRTVLYVSQQPYLFSGTVKDNLFDCTDYQITESDEIILRACHIDKLLEQLPEGWETAVREGGGNLSGGQRQRLIIARALLRRPKILILDEPINEIDAKARKSIIDNLHVFRTDLTLLIITHNADEYDHVDQVVDFDALIPAKELVNA